MKIELLTFADCPNAGAARDALARALRAEAVDAAVEEIDIGRDDAPTWSRAWGSPTILIDGEDVTGAANPSGEIGCRLYAGGAPSVDQIRERLRLASGASPAASAEEVRTVAGREPGDRR